MPRPVRPDTNDQPECATWRDSVRWSCFAPPAPPIRWWVAWSPTVVTVQCSAFNSSSFVLPDAVSSHVDRSCPSIVVDSIYPTGWTMEWRLSYLFPPWHPPFPPSLSLYSHKNYSMILSILMCICDRGSKGEFLKKKSKIKENKVIHVIEKERSLEQE